MKKSWTTSSIVSAVESEAETARKEVTEFKSRDLIREYLLKSVKVPEILKPQRQCQSKTFSTSAEVETEINLAYKHPLVIAEELQIDEDGGETLAQFDNSSIIVPHEQQQQCHRRHSSHRRHHHKSSDHESRPHLIGKVTPNIARTWEQLTSAMDFNDEIEIATEADVDVEGEEEEDKQSYILFVRKPFNFHQSDDNDYKIHHQHHVESEKFYDSIDEYGDDDYEEEIDSTIGGEMMAEQIDSLEMRRMTNNNNNNNNVNDDDVIVWSIESS